MLQQHSQSDHTSLINSNEGSTPVSIPCTESPFAGLQLDMFVSDATTHTHDSHPASERPGAIREEVAYA